VTDAGAGTLSQGDGPGPSLRRARESLGMTEQQAAEQLNLDATVVRALESDDLAALGAPVFARGHLRRYGSLLGLPEESLFAAYERAATQPAQPSLVPHSRQEMTPVSRGRPVWPWAVGGAVLVLLAAGLVAYVSEFGLTLPQVGSPREVPTVALDAGVEPHTGVTAPERVGATVGAAPTVAEMPIVAGADSPGPAAADPVMPPGHVSVAIAFAADSWVEIYDSTGQTVLYDLGRAGTERKLAAAAPLSVTLGNAAAVTLRVNEGAVAVPVPPAGQSVARFTIAADGSLRRAGG
jgi:cytoskeleton protein RodZ